MAEMKPVLARLDGFVREKMHAAQVPGLAVALTDRDRLLNVSCWGYANFDARTPWTADTLCEIGSISKSFTAITIMRLVEQGRLDVQWPVTNVLPWFVVQSEHESITIHHLLSHSAGISRGTDLSGESRGEVYSLRETRTFAPPGKAFYYSNAGYKTLGVIVENMYGKPYGDVIQELVLDPLGMASTHAVITHETRRKLAVGYNPFYDDRPATPSHPMVPATWLETDTGDGSIASTPADMAAYVRMLLARGLGPGGRVLEEESFASMTSAIIERQVPGRSGWYGYGLMSHDDHGHKIVHHSGGMVGYLADIAADMDGGLGVVVMTNGRVNPSEIGEYALSLLRAWREGAALPDGPLLPDLSAVPNAADYVGRYRCGDRSFLVITEGSSVVMVRGGERIVLLRDPSAPDTFRAAHRELEAFALKFGRQDGKVVEALYGSDWYPNEQYKGPLTFAHPSEWDAYVGHYRSYNPWLSNFRVILRKGGLAASIAGVDFGEEAAFVPMGDGRFNVGPLDASPEQVRFDLILDGKARRATFSGAQYWRTFTP